MAFAAELKSLTEDLVRAVLPSSRDDPAKFKQQRDAAVRNLKSHNFLRTNQFDVKSQLDGLEERFRVQHREGLADALSNRLTTLDLTPQKWHPEILAVLLDLSDRPLYKTRLSDIEGLHPDGFKPADQLRWEDIAKEDGWDEDGNLWKTNRHRDTSDDDFSITDSETSEPPSEHDSGDGVNVGLIAEHHIIQPQDTKLFNSIREAQQWRTTKPTSDANGNARKIAVDEVQLIREILFMLQGLDTTMFDAKCLPLPSFQTAHLAWDTHRAVINAFSESGRQLRILRRFTEGYQEATHAEAFQDCVSKRLHDLDVKLSSIHQRLVAPEGDVVVSLVSLKTELSSWLEPLHTLSDIMVRIEQEPDPGAFRYLELLYDQASLCQLSGQTKIYEYLARIFMECFDVYLRPIRLWMDQGKLLPNDKIFFVCETEEDPPLSELWRGRFELRETQEGKLHAPSFLRPSVAKIINAGKNIVVLNRLGQDISSKGVAEPPLDYDTVCPPGFDLAPFPDLFASAFDCWIQSKYRATSTILKDVLCEKCSLPSELQFLQRVYLMVDGSASSTFCGEVFERIDSLDRRWHDRYALTAITHDAFSDVVDTNRISVSVGPEALNTHLTEARTRVRSVLPSINITYRLPWPIQMVLSPHSVVLYQMIFTLLLQFKRATSVLHKPKILEHYWTDNSHWAERALYYSCRNSLLWFCTTIQTYLATLVLAPNISKLEQAINEAQDVDTLTYVHDIFIKHIVDEACLGSRLTPIRECMLDVLDLAIALESQHPEEEYIDVLRGIKGTFEKHLGFIIGGLRSVARASSDAQAAKWDTLAEMLHSGSK